MSEIVFTLSKKDLLLSYLERMLMRREMIMLMVMLVVFSIVFWLKKGGFNYVSLIAAGWVPSIVLVQLYWINRLIRSNPLLISESVLTFDENGLALTSEFSKSETPWKSIIKYAEGGRYFHLYISDLHAITIPKRAFSNDRLEGFRTFLSDLNKA